MFMVFSSEKIKSFLISACTVLFLFVIGKIAKKTDTKEVSTSINNITNNSFNIIHNEISE